MKNKPVILVVLCFLSLLSGCKSDQKMIENSAMGYLTAMGNYRIKEAEAFASEETIEKTLHVIEELIMPRLDSSVIAKNTPATIEIKEIKVSNDTTAEVLYVKTTPAGTQDGKLDLVKRNKEWKAQVIMVVPNFLKYDYNVDSKSIEDKYMGKLKPVKDTTRSTDANPRIGK